MTEQHTPNMVKSIQRNGLLLMAFAVLCTAILAAVNILTKPIIEQQQQLQKQRTLDEILNQGNYDNVPALDCITVKSSLLNGEQIVYRATKERQPYAALIETVAPDGYSGEIKLLVGLNTNSEIIGVRALSHKETPGLGDKVDVSKSDWILDFTSKKLTAQNESLWAVKKDGGMFDSFTGATITPRSVVKAVKKTAEYFAANQTLIFDSANQCNNLEIEDQQQAIDYE